MTTAADPITFSVPRSVLSNISHLSEELTARMHHLLERNTDHQLNPTESSELETLIQLAQFGQIVSMALQPRPTP